MSVPGQGLPFKPGSEIVPLSGAWRSKPARTAALGHFADESAAGSMRGNLANKRQARRFSYVAETIPQSYSITLSARSKIDGGIVIGSAFAVLRFTTNSDLVGCSIGSSAGFAPLAIRSTYPAAHANMTVKPGP